VVKQSDLILLHLPLGKQTTERRSSAVKETARISLEITGATLTGRCIISDRLRRGYGCR